VGTTGYSPNPELIYTECRVKEYILWLQTYYLPGSTTRNKCWHLKNYVAFLRLRKQDATLDQVRCMIICKKLFNKAANESKQVARTDRVLLEDEYHMTNIKSMCPHPLFFFVFFSLFFKSFLVPFFLFGTNAHEATYPLVRLIELHASNVSARPYDAFQVR
jgi:hypothetical protein